MKVNITLVMMITEAGLRSRWPKEVEESPLEDAEGPRGESGGEPSRGLVIPDALSRNTKDESRGTTSVIGTARLLATRSPRRPSWAGSRRVGRVKRDPPL